ncbi:MAG TPA: FAD-linked oxidase C-terminal domain-containing protein [Mycobacteriales bacterium]|nr:FAD-linked oxidase C-terminal domain-containing protein [Mycobacteriales bacterium]
MSELTASSDRRYHPHPTAETVDVKALERELRKHVRGEVRFDAGARAVWSTDASNFRMPPLGVVQPLDIDDVIAAVTACHAHRAPITNRGGGTSLSGETTNVAVILDTSKYVTNIHELDVEQRFAWVEPGCINDTLRDRAQEHQLDFGPDPSTHDRCTIGGNIGNNSCGVHSVMAGRTSDNTLALDVVLYDGTRLELKSSYDDSEISSIIRAGGRQGEIFGKLLAIRDRYGDEIRKRYPQIPRRVSGYNLDDLLPEKGFNVAASLVGTEGTCATVLKAKLRLVPWPRHRSLLVLGYHDIAEAADHGPEILNYGPIGLEAIDDVLIGYMRRLGKNAHELTALPEGRNFLLVEFGGDDKEEADAKARECMARLEADLDTPHMKLFDDPSQERVLWEVREGGLGAEAQVPGRGLAWPGWEDSAVAPDKLGDYLRDLKKLYKEHGYDAAMYGHFGDGCIHSTIPFDLTTAEGLRDYRKFLEEASDLVVSYGGSLSGEHGDGQQRAEFLDKMYGADLVRAMREFKAVWDPDGLMNPGKVVDPIRVFKADENMRLGLDYKPASPSTYFAFPNDGGSLERATLRCVGVGKCRTLGGQTMCPSYQTLREEEHSTRGRARILFEMLQGDVITDGWKSQEVFDALDLCLSCKGCKNDCPMTVDMATYKSEFLAHYYEGKVRPRHAYAMGLIMYAARIGAHVPRLANFALHAPLVSRLLKHAGGVHPKRKAPYFAEQTFREWFAKRSRVNVGKPRVMLFPDTFSNHFHTDVAKAVCEVIEAAGFEVIIPPKVLCCGRPLFDYGMLGRARKMFEDVLETLDEEIARGTPMVVPEPSCGASFRDELIEMLPHDRQAQRLSKQTYTLAEFLDKFAPDFEIPQVDRKILVQRHCHHQSVMGFDSEKKVLEETGADVEIPDSGCCGLAGSWGFEKEKYDISMDCGERVIFPKVRDAAPGDVILADGFSCRTQIEQGTGRRAIHLAQLIQAALPGGRELPPERPERAFEGEPRGTSTVKQGALLAAFATGAAVAASAAVKRRAHH